MRIYLMSEKKGMMYIIGLQRSLTYIIVLAGTRLLGLRANQKSANLRNLIQNSIPKAKVFQSDEETISTVHDHQAHLDKKYPSMSTAIQYTKVLQ